MKFRKYFWAEGRELPWFVRAGTIFPWQKGLDTYFLPIMEEIWISAGGAANWLGGIVSYWACPASESVIMWVWWAPAQGKRKEKRYF